MIHEPFTAVPKHKKGIRITDFIIRCERGNFKKTKSSRIRIRDEKTYGKEDSDCLDFLEAAAADQFALEFGQAALSSAELAVRFVLTQDDGIALHEYFEGVLGADIQRTAKFNGQDDTSQGIQLAGNSSCFHGKNLLTGG